jgi:hypothetical protein
MRCVDSKNEKLEKLFFADTYKIKKAFLFQC